MYYVKRGLLGFCWYSLIYSRIRLANQKVLQEDWTTWQTYPTMTLTMYATR